MSKRDLKAVVAQTIVDAMGNRKVSQAQLAKRLRCSEANVSQMLDGTRNLTICLLDRIARAAGYRLEISLRRRKAQ